MTISSASHRQSTIQAYLTTSSQPFNKHPHEV